MALQGARGAQFLLDDSGRIVGYIDGNGIERNMAGDRITPGSTPLPGAFRQSGIVIQSAVPASVTGTLSETVLATIPIPAGAMGVNGSLRITAYWTYTNSPNNKVLKAMLGGQSVVSVVRTTSATDFWMFEIMNRGVANSQVKPASPFPYGSSANAFQTMTVDTSVAQSLTLTGTLANTGETITFEGYTVEILNP